MFDASPIEEGTNWPLNKRNPSRMAQRWRRIVPHTSHERHHAGHGGEDRRQGLLHRMTLMGPFAIALKDGSTTTLVPHPVKQGLETESSQDSNEGK